MNVELALVTSVNGHITDGTSSNIYEWTSKEDQQHFFSLIDKHTLIIMGRKTYEASASVIQLKPKKLRTVMTRNPEQYQKLVVPGQLEFSKESPVRLIERLHNEGYTSSLVVGGNEVAEAFFQSHLITSLYLTIEPYLFGAGTKFIDTLPERVDLELQSVRQLNTKGTLLLHYMVLSP